jgi:hypothetical protein
MTAFNNAYSQNTVTNRMDNFFVDAVNNKFSFDIFTLRTSAPPFRMGYSSYIINVLPFGALDTPVVLSNINPRFTAGSPSNSYLAMRDTSYRDITTGLVKRIGVQVVMDPNGGIGDTINGDPSVNNGRGERIATVTIGIRQQVLLNISWDVLNSAIVSPTFQTATSLWLGNATVILPVELSDFTSVVNRNNVTLNWSTARETNNSGFEIERKNSGANSTWNKIGFVNGSGNSQEIRSYNFNDNGLSSGNYNYRLKQIDFNGNFEYFELQNEVNVGVPSQFELSQNYPNPFNPTTKINFSIPVDSKVTLNIYDITGKLVSTLINNEFRLASYYTMEFNASNFSSGTYFYTIRTDKFNETKKMILIK